MNFDWIDIFIQLTLSSRQKMHATPTNCETDMELANSIHQRCRAHPPFCRGEVTRLWSGRRRGEGTFLPRTGASNSRERSGAKAGR